MARLIIIFLRQRLAAGVLASPSFSASCFSQFLKAVSHFWGFVCETKREKKKSTAQVASRATLKLLSQLVNVFETRLQLRGLDDN
ncbi:hypothetical protein GGI43DRAFT_394647 [Trichoderma evansii]